MSSSTTSATSLPSIWASHGTLNSTITDALGNATTKAQTYIDGKTFSSGSYSGGGSRNVGNTYVNNSTNIGSGNTSYNFGGGSSSGSDKNSTRVLTGIVATGALFAMAWLLGKGAAQYGDINENLKEANEAKKEFLKANYQEKQGNDAGNSVYKAINKVLTASKEMFGTQKSNALFGLVTKVTLATAAVIALIGAIAGSEAAMLTGAVIAITDITVMLFKAGWDYFSNPNLKAAQKVVAAKAALDKSISSLSTREGNSTVRAVDMKDNKGSTSYSQRPAPVAPSHQNAYPSLSTQY